MLTFGTFLAADVTALLTVRTHSLGTCEGVCVCVWVGVCVHGGGGGGEMLAINPPLYIGVAYCFAHKLFIWDLAVIQRWPLFRGGGFDTDAKSYIFVSLLVVVHSPYSWSHCLQSQQLYRESSCTLCTHDPSELTLLW